MSSLQIPVAVQALSALAQGSRLAVFRLLVRAGSGGMSAGDIAREVGVLPNTLSSHIAILVHAGLVQAQRNGRSIIFRARYDQMSDLIQFLIDDCCGGHPELCFPNASSSCEQTTKISCS